MRQRFYHIEIVVEIITRRCTKHVRKPSFGGNLVCLKKCVIVVRERKDKKQLVVGASKFL